MSQTAVSGRQPDPVMTKTLTVSELDEIREYQKIVQFRDTVVSGNHPRIKVPTSVLAKHATATTPSSSSAAPHGLQPSPLPAQSHVASTTTTQPPVGNAVNGLALSNLYSVKTNTQQPAVTIHPVSSACLIPGFSRPLGTGKPQIDPVLLEKSDDLIKAEFRIRRERIEKGLNDQLDQQRSASKRTHSYLSEQLSEIDLADILAKALTLVQATAPPQPPAFCISQSTANASDASDSFDENTFYSSQHDTPESHTSSRRHDEMRNIPMPTSTQVPASFVNPFVASTPATSTGQGGVVNQNARGQPSPAVPKHNSDMNSASNTLIHKVLDSRQRREQLDAQVISSESRGPSRSDHSGNTDTDQSADQQRSQTSQNLMPNPNLRQLKEPLIRAHNLSPLAPQPAHVSPLAVARQPPLPNLDHSALQRVSSQLTNVRQEHALVISPDSSPQGDKGSKKRNKKKGKRKSDGKSRENICSPDIKPEPRSPSPVSALPLMHPPKRRRGGRRGETIYDDTAPDRPMSQLQAEQLAPSPLRIEPHPPLRPYERTDDPYTPQVRRSIAPLDSAPHSTWYEERQPDGSIIRYLQPAQTPAAYSDSHIGRTVSYSVVNSDYRDGPAYSRDPRDGRMSTRPPDRPRSRSPTIVERHSSSVYPPAVPRRIVIDEFGREYLEPPRPSTISRQSMMPPSRPGEPEVIYERAPARAMSRMPASEIIGEDGTIYRRASPGYAARRVITQPEYGSEVRSYRDREYSTQPMAPPSQEYYQIRGGTEQRVAEHMPREYLARAASVRPSDPVSYQRLPSTRPDLQTRQYTASVHPEARVEPSYSVRPAETIVPHRAYSVRPSEQYYDQPPPGEGMTYYERPRGVHQEIIYPDGTRRQVYQ
ncbi:hypothetical protein F5Y16DRAFT_387931 [Xylariaceae sp. FL0255]|nr:hypothetical protein F5Y16DRAFT_387931 [Xylariaceae sp. FL0255]